MLDHKQQYKYRVGGPLGEDDPCYVERQADKDLYEALMAGEYCYILSSRQMGKSSLVVRARKKLEADGIAVAYIDLTLLGTDHVSLDQWYTTLLSNLADSFELEVDLTSWWHKHEKIVPLARLSKFIETFLLAKEPQQRYVIVVDEIDTVLSLQEFRADDFFAFIRGCCIQRTHKPEYNRLTFVLIGVATPADLIADRDRTPFNLGRAIALHGFAPAEVYPLAKGLEGDLVERPAEVLAAILQWTGGQPFLTQKLCQLIWETHTGIPTGQETEKVEQLVNSRIINNWEENDKPQHLGTIRDRIIRNMLLNNILNVKDEQHASNLLGLYQKILQYGKISADNSPEQEDLRLSGLVIKQDGILRVYNRIYQEVFNQPWVQKELAKLRPYREQITAWSNSNYMDESRLLHGKALQDAIIWAKAKQLSDEDEKFLDTSRAFAQLAQATPEVASVLRNALPQLQTITSHLFRVIQEIQRWAGAQPFLTDQLCQLLIQAKSQSPIAANTEAAQVEQLVRSHLIQDWENQPAGDHLKAIEASILEDEHRVELLNFYRQVLQQTAAIVNYNPEWNTLVNLGLVNNLQGKPQVTNQIYATVFNQEWVEQALIKKRQIIGERYEVIRELSQNDFIQNYLAKDQHRSKQYVIKQLIPISNDIETVEETKRLISKKLRDFGKIDSSLIPDLDPYFEEDRLYIIQEYIEGHNLDENNEIKSGQQWHEPQVIRLLIEILASLVPIHQQELAHLNLNPTNLRRQHQAGHAPGGRIIPIDFGFLKEIAIAMANPGQPVQPQQIGVTGYVPPKETGDWSELNCDIYAVGMIGIQALTGLEPKNLPKDQQTHEIIWRFATPGKKMVAVSDELTRILTKMVRHDAAARYANASEVYQDLKTLQSRKRSLYFWLADRRILAVSIGILCLTNIFSLWWQQRFAEEQKNIQQTKVSRTQLSEQNQHCNQPIQAKQPIKDRFIDVQMVADAKQVIDACSKADQNQQNLINQGKALLLLSQSSLQLSRSNDALNYLNQAKSVFSTAREIDNHPKAHFYLGLVNQLQKRSYQNEYKAAIDLYLKSEQTTPGDYFILTQLAAVAANANRFDSAIQLYEKAINTQPSSVMPLHLANLRYNQAILSNKSDGINYSSAKTRRFLSLATELDSKHQLTDEYSNKCLGQGELQAPDRCAALSAPLPVFSCQHYPILAIVEPNKAIIQSRCEV